MQPPTFFTLVILYLRVRAEELEFGKVWKVQSGDYETFISTEVAGAVEEPVFTKNIHTHVSSKNINAQDRTGNLSRVRRTS